MNNFLKKIWIFTIASVLAGIPAIQASLQASQTFLYLFYDGGRAGEKNQVLGVGKALKEHLPENTVRKEFDLKDKEAFLSDVRQNLKKGSQNKVVVVAAEVGSIPVLVQLGPQPNMVIAHSSHQFTKDHARLDDVADIVALPQGDGSNEVKSAISSSYTTLIQTAGVPHNLSPKDIQEAYEKNKESLPAASTYIGIILGGDAETPGNKLLYYTTVEAVQMANYIAPQVMRKKAHLLILNGPRTGKHNQATGELIATSHRDGSVDAVTTAFLEALKGQGLTQGQDFTLLDFQFDKPSAYPVVLGALHATNSSIFVAGESTSMVSEAADCLPGVVTAFTNGAMNENHREHCARERAGGRINILENRDGHWELLPMSAPSRSQDSRPASHIIAEAIKKRLEEKS